MTQQKQTRLPDALPKALLDLLDLVGPKEAPLLLRQLQADLSTCEAMIATGSQRGDWANLRLASHNLTALAGTAGSTRLQDMAQTLNQIAHAADNPALAGITPTLLTDLRGLINLLDKLSQPGAGR